MENQKLCLGCMEYYDSSLDTCPHCGYVDGKENAHVLHMPPGTILHKQYIIGKALGYGSFGVTYIGWDKMMRRKVAIKEYLPSEYATRKVEDTDLTIPESESQQQKFEKGMKKFRQEAEKLAKLGHVDGVVYVYDTFEENNTAYIVMEYLNGETLASYLKRNGVLSEKETLELMIPLLQALQAVHEQNIIHRDISPDNIFIATDSAGNRQVKLIDFGAARFATSSHSKSLTVLLRPGYSPEEQYRSSGEQGPHTDVYAIAAVMYQMVTGVIPPDALERRTSIERKKRDLLVDPGKYNKDLSDNFETALTNALNVKIEDRTPTADEFLKEIISFEKVKPRGSSIKRIDFMRWPLWAKIGVPIASVAAVAVLIGVGFWLRYIMIEQTEITLPDGYTRVMDLVGTDLQEAGTHAEKNNLLVSSQSTEYSSRMASDLVLRQDITPGMVVLENTSIGVVVSSGEENYSLPDVTGFSEEQARLALECMDLEVITAVSDEAAEGIAGGCVVKQDIDPYSDVKSGDTITITITDGGETKSGKAPSLSGMTYEEAVAAATEKGLSIQVTEKVFSDDYKEGEIISQSIAKGKTVEASTPIEVTLALPVRDFKMPALVYKQEDVATQLLTNIGISPSVESLSSELLASGVVAEQSVQKDETVTPGDAVVMKVSTGSKPFAMPNVTGDTEENAVKTLRDSSLAVSVEYDYDAKVEEGHVISQSIAAGEDVTRGTTVTIVVCSSEDLIELSDVSGLTQEEAKTKLEALGLKVEINEVYSDEVEEGLVMSQAPEAGTRQKAGSTVVLTISKGAELFQVENVVGKQSSDAVAILEKAGFTVTTIEASSDKASGTVIAQDPEAGSKEKAGTLITLTISTGSEQKPATSGSPSGNGDTPTPSATPAPSWSDWVTSLPSGVSAAGYDIETKTQYRSRKRSTTTSSNSTMDGWTLYDTKSVWSDYGGWSDWSTSAVTPSDSTKVETKTQYRYADVETTTSTDANLSGWTQSGSTSSWGDYGGWSGWQDGTVSSSDSRQVETRQVWGYYRFVCPNCGAYSHGWGSGACYTWAGGCGSDIPEGSYQQLYSTVSWDSAGLTDWYGTGKYYTTALDGTRWFKWPESGSPKTQSRYRDRSQITTYSYWRWGGWSDWSDTAYSSSDSRKVETQTLYRYATRTQSTTYYFEQWSSWSSWSESPISSSSDVDVETRTLYRYKRK